MSANTPAAAPAKGKKMLVIILGLVVVLLLAGTAAVWFLMRSNSDDEGAERGARREAAKPAPTFLAIENLVVNLADPGGDRFAQVGITLELADAKTADQVKQYLPTIRSGTLMLISQRSSAELLQLEGKEKLAADILKEVAKPLGYVAPKPRARQEASDDDDLDEDDRPARKRADRNPVRGVFFSSFIIQ